MPNDRADGPQQRDGQSTGAVHKTANGNETVQMEKVGVIGGGLMRSGIAEICARADKDVIVVESSDAAVEAAQRRLGGSLKRAEGRGKIESADRVMSRIRVVDSVDAVTDASSLSRPSSKTRTPKRPCSVASTRS